ncbi:MAG: tRNA (adenosine(37)-N6)-threonylcarbamoyltransferase complex ATPase subunit type 1 TsaE [Clostridia bacterium]|nr:tRNA (adenosine(37)-N6)-threonylcarbamoyltransferase complex ATPase subunit type 1 TsaE [Clostridia bacterium]
MTQRYITNSPDETIQLGSRLATSLSNSVVAFFGDLGAGKTTFVTGMCQGIGYSGETSSPTFAIVHEYMGGRLPLYHFDMYRVESVDDLYSCGFYDYLDNGILAIEWSENIIDALPDNAIRVHISYGESDNQRIVEITGRNIT